VARLRGRRVARPGIAALLSLPVCGLGHLYAGRPFLGAFLYLFEWGLAAAAVLLALWWEARASLIVAALLYIGYRLGVAALAARSARRRTRPHRLPAAVRWPLYAAVLAGSLLASREVGAVFRNALTRSFRVVGAGMGDTVRDGERILVNLAAYGIPHPLAGGEARRLRDPQRGDVICYRARNAKGGESIWIHRVVALPGDHLEIRDRTVFVNGEALEEPYVSEPAREPYGPFRIWKQHFVVLGDDRVAARDSRYPTPGLVHRRRILGQAACIWWGRFGRRIR